MSLAILSGKGGVGKTTWPEPGLRPASAGNRVLIMDCDLGLANLDVLLGISRNATPGPAARGCEPGEVVAAVEPRAWTSCLRPRRARLVDMDEDMQGHLFPGSWNGLSYHFLLLTWARASTARSCPSPAAAWLPGWWWSSERPRSPTATRSSRSCATSTESGTFGCGQPGRRRPRGPRNLSSPGHGLQDLPQPGHREHGFVRQDATALEAVRQQTPLLKLAPKAPAAKDILALAAKIQRARESTLEGLAEASILSHLGPRP